MTHGIRRTFIELFNDQPFSTIVVPIIQRDYAQGRESAEEVRTQFLESLHDTLLLPEGDTKLPLDLDFVYGSLEGNDNKTFSLLDGQQRLTTLFLLHWYLAARDQSSGNFQSRMMQKENSRFSYQVRPSSQDFCDALVKHTLDFDHLLPSDPDAQNQLSKTLANESWFFLSWQQDPTIMSALSMLDGIHRRFKETSGLYEKITKLETPYITFQFLNLQDFGLSDDLYIKMNSRGKPLTAFEVFKAQVEPEFKKKLPEEIRELSGTDVAIVDYFSRKVDACWSDFFWAYRDHETNIFDRQFMNFIRAMALVMYANEHPEMADESVNRVLEELLDTKRDFSYLQYAHMDCLTPGFLKAMVDILDTVSGSTEQASYLSEQSHVNGSDIFRKILDGKSMSYTEWVRFYGYCAYVIQSPEQAAKPSFMEWMRLVTNLATYTIYNRVDEFRLSLVALLRLLKDMTGKSVIDFVAESVQATFTGFNRQQAREERLKAQLMLRHSEWSACIRDAEQHGYFNGQIEFLLRFSGVQLEWHAHKENCTWDDEADQDFRYGFKTYYQKSEMVFDSNGLKNFPDFVWERALLSMGDYLLKTARNDSFLDSTDRDVSWKRLLRGSDQEGETYNTKRDLVRLLLDQVDTGDVDGSLHKVIDQYLGQADFGDWRAKFVGSVECIQYCGKRQIRRANGLIHLLTKTQMNGVHAELFTYYLFKVHLESMMAKGSLAPFDKVSYWEEYCDADTPDVYLYFEAENLYLEIEREAAKYLVSCYHWNEDADNAILPKRELLEALIAEGLVGFEQKEDCYTLSVDVDNDHILEVVTRSVCVIKQLYV